MNQAEVAAQLAATPLILRRQLAWLDDELLRWRPEADAWCIKEIIGHLIEADRHAFAARIERMIEAEEPELPPVDIDEMAAARHDDERSLLDLLDELETQRAAYANMVRTLTAEQMARSGRHTKYGRFLVSDFVYEWAYHDGSHLIQLYELLRQHIWPQFSEAMQRALHR